MALLTWTVREALEGANARLVLLQTDARLSGAQQALVGELVQANILALNVLRVDNTIAAGQRTARAQQITDKVFALGTVEASTEAFFTPDAFYNALDLSHDAAERCIRVGLPTFLSDID